MNTVQKTVLITGGSRGLGKNMALAVAAKGLNVILTFRSNEEEARKTVSEIEQAGVKAAALKLNMSEFSSLDHFITDLKQVLAAWGNPGLDYLVNNAGMGTTVPFMQVTEELFTDFLNVHFKGVYFLTQKTIPLMNEGGGIINISTGTTRFSNPGYSVYATMKGAVEVLSRYLAKELGAKGLRANTVAPGPVETDFNNAAIRSNPDLKTRLSSLSPLNRVGEAGDIGGVVAFLCTPDAAWINGQRIEVSGGING